MRAKMKPFFGIIAVSLALIMIFTGCDIKNVTTIPPEPVLTGEPEGELSFEESTETLSKAVTIAAMCSVNLYDWVGSTNKCDYLGYYAALNCEKTGFDYLSESDIALIQSVADPEDAVINVQDYLQKGEIEARITAEGTFIYFPRFIADLEKINEKCKFTVTADESTLKVKVTVESDIMPGEVNIWYYKNDKNSKRFPYSIDEMSFDFMPQEQDDLPFTVDDLIKANSVDKLVENHGSFDYKTLRGETLLRRVGGCEINSVCVTAMERFNDDGTAVHQYTYDGDLYEKNFDHYTSVLYDGNLITGNNMLPPYSPANEFYGGNINITKNENGIIGFYIYDFRSDSESGGSYYEVEKDTLALLNAKKNTGSESEYDVTVNYGGEAPMFNFTDGWNENEIKKEELSIHLENPNGRTPDFTIPYELPFNLEIVPSIDEDYELYDETGNIYSYPGNGIDFAVKLVEE